MLAIYLDDGDLLTVNSTLQQINDQIHDAEVAHTDFIRVHFNTITRVPGHSYQHNLMPDKIILLNYRHVTMITPESVPENEN